MSGPGRPRSDGWRLTPSPSVIKTACPSRACRLAQCPFCDGDGFKRFSAEEWERRRASQKKQLVVDADATKNGRVGDFDG